jgi:hypothetical protein
MQYVEGSPMFAKDIRRAAVERCSACFFLTDKFCHDASEEDSSSIMLALAVQQYLTDHRNSTGTTHRWVVH